MVKITWKPGAMLSPLPPALVSCGTLEKPNVLTIAWTGIISSEPALTYVSIRPTRYSHELIKENGEFVINIPNLDMLVATDFCGMKSGRDIDKFKEMNLTAGASSQVSAPQIMEAPISIECKVKSVSSHGSHDMFLAEIVAVNVDDKYINKDGKLCLEKMGILAFAHGTYFTLGRLVGTFGFSVNKRRLAEVEKMKEVKVEVKQSKIVKKKPAEHRSSDRRHDRDERRSTSFRSDGTKKDFKPRGERKFDDKPRKFREDGEKPKRDFGDRPRPPRDGGERRKPFGDGDRKPRSFGDRKPVKRFSR